MREGEIESYKKLQCVCVYERGRDRNLSYSVCVYMREGEIESYKKLQCVCV